MRNHRHAIVFTAFFLAISVVGTVAMAEETYNTVLGLLDECREVEKVASTDLNSTYWGLCHGRIEGYFIGTETWARPKPFCAPSETTRADLVKAFVRWAEANPGKWSEPSYVGLYNALTDAFPCQQTK